MVNHIEYDMEEFLSSCVDRYCELAGANRSNLRSVPTPFIDEASSVKEEEVKENFRNLRLEC